MPAGRFSEQVTRNIERCPEDFAFQLTIEESANLRSQMRSQVGVVVGSLLRRRVRVFALANCKSRLTVQGTEGTLPVVTTESVIPIEHIASQIYIIRSER